MAPVGRCECSKRLLPDVAASGLDDQLAVLRKHLGERFEYSCRELFVLLGDHSAVVVQVQALEGLLHVFVLVQQLPLYHLQQPCHMLLFLVTPHLACQLALPVDGRTIAQRSQRRRFLDDDASEFVQ